ncbi:MAG: hypothetical protein AAGT88_06330 [Dethiobacter sp.]
MLSAQGNLRVISNPAAAGQENGKERRNVSTPEIQHLDAEVQVIAGQPVLQYQTGEGYAEIPFEWPTYAISADGQRVPVERQGESILLPAEGGSVAVLLNDFCVVMVAGHIKLLAEVNLAWKLIPAVIGVAFKIKLISALSKAGISAVPTFHFIERAVLSGISIPRIIQVLTTGQRLVDIKSGDRVIRHSGLRIAVIIARNSNTLKTIMDNANLKKHWVPRNWSW